MTNQQDPINETPGMEPDEVGRYKYATEPAPDEPGAEETEGHMPRSYAKEPAPDEPGAEETEGHVRGRSASEPAPDEPGAEMNPDDAARIKF